MDKGRAGRTALIMTVFNNFLYLFAFTDISNIHVNKEEF